MFQNPLNDYLGKGLTYPIQLDENGTPVISGGLDLIKSSLLVILTWDNYRIFLEDFRCRIVELIEEQNSIVLISVVKVFIRNAITKYEPRIKLLDITVINQDFDKIEFFINYKINNTSIEDSFIYPFYRNTHNQ